ncbi:ATP-binding cassette domain-containing protein [Corynebacterium hansenii]|uniref:ATP-binding cassette domain-containing protein n=1 Tax=Corynebacterium hansenii TaxID=394964 RepID=A0ABV7ZSC0_9CORY|nr:ATP-binding cassette domain-containing protein [Corynebacterium hansenii]WJY99722.1 putative ABC transporter ATP-binding protein YxlF [Corynebacterium hansenii]
MNFTGVHVALGALVALQILLIAAALIVLARTPADRIKLLSKPVWVPVILLANGIGPIVFFAVGRERAGRSAPATTAPATGDLLEKYGAAVGPGTAISFDGVRKTYGDHVVLDGVTLEVPHGSVFGFLGPNGSGKTTALRILMGLSRADAGVVTLDGKVGYLPDVPAFDPWATPAEYLRLSARLEGYRGGELDSRVGEALALSGLAAVDRPVSGLSRGMRQRLGIAQALIATPGIVVLDEPTSALDPISRREVLDVIASLRGRATVFFSTHSMADVEAVCDRAAFLGRGRILAAGTLPELVEEYGDPGRVTATFRAPDAGAAARALEAAGCTDVATSTGGALDDAFANAMGGAR